MRVCISDSQIKGKHLLYVNFETGSDLHMAYTFLIYNLVSKIHAFEVQRRRFCFASSRLFFFFFLFFPGLFYCFVSICLVLDSSIVAICLSTLAVRFAFCLYLFFLFLLFLDIKIENK